MKFRTVNFVSAAVFILTVIAVSHVVEAAGVFCIKAEPRFVWSLNYEDNILHDVRNRQSGFSQQYNPSLGVEFSSPLVSLQGRSSVNIIEYLDGRQFDCVDQDHELGISLRPTARLEVRAVAGYRVDSRPDRFFNEETFMDTGGGYIVRVHRDKTELGSVAVNYQLSPAGRICLRFGFSGYDTYVTDNSDLYLVCLDYYLRVSRKTVFHLNARACYFDFDQAIEGPDVPVGNTSVESNSDAVLATCYEMINYSFLMGLSHVPVHGLKIGLDVGWRYTVTEMKTGLEKISEDKGLERTVVRSRTNGRGNGFVFVLAIHKELGRGTLLRFNLKKETGVNPSSGGAYESRSLIFDAVHRFSGSVSGRFSFQYHLHDSQSGDEFIYRVDRRYYYLSAGLSYDISSSLSCSVNLSRSSGKDNLMHEQTSRDMIFCGLHFKCLTPFILR